MALDRSDRDPDQSDRSGSALAPGDNPPRRERKESSRSILRCTTRPENFRSLRRFVGRTPLVRSGRPRRPSFGCGYAALRGRQITGSLEGLGPLADARGYDSASSSPLVGQQAHVGAFSAGTLSSTIMRFHTEHLTFNTKQHRQYINITPQVEAALEKSKIREGMILVSAMHITAGVWVNDAEDGLLADIDEWLEKLAPFRENYRHHRTGETNGDSHLKSLIVHHQVIVPVTEGRLDFGPWQQVYYAEFDGQRPKRVIIKVMGE